MQLAILLFGAVLGYKYVVDKQVNFGGKENKLRWLVHIQ